MDVRDELLRLLSHGAVDQFNEISRRSRQIIDLSEIDLPMHTGTRPTVALLRQIRASPKA